MLKKKGKLFTYIEMNGIGQSLFSQRDPAREARQTPRDSPCGKSFTESGAHPAPEHPGLLVCRILIRIMHVLNFKVDSMSQPGKPSFLL